MTIKKRMSITALASKAGVPAGNLYRVKHGKCNLDNLSLKTIKSIVAVTKPTLAELFEKELKKALDIE